MKKSPKNTRTIQDKLNFFKEFGYIPHKEQLKVHDAFLNNRFAVVAAGARSGKSLLAAAEIMDEFCRPNRRIWCVSSRYELAEKPIDWFMNFAGQMYLGSRRMIDYCKISNVAKGSCEITAPWGSFVKTKSTEKPQGLLGEELDLIVGDEWSTVKREPWDRMLVMRLVSRKGKAVLISTPNGDGGLFLDQFEKGQKQEDGYWSTQFKTYDNPHIDVSELESAKLRMTEENFREQVMGEFISRRGKVFNFVPEHVVDTLPSNILDMPVVYGIKLHQHNPSIIIEIHYDKENKIYYVTNEFYQANALVKDITRKVIDMSRGKNMIAVVGDFFNDLGRKQLEENGLSVSVNYEKKLNNNQGQIKRIQLVQNLLKLEEKSLTKLKIHVKCTSIINDFTRCTWGESKAEKERLDPEMPNDMHLAGIMALSYPCAFLENTMGNSIY